MHKEGGIIVKSDVKTGFLSGCAVFATIVGAGFASGKEVWYYFAQYGGVCYPIIILMGCLFFVLCVVCLQFGKTFQISTVKQMNYVLYRKFSFIAEIVLCLSNFILLSTMLAGADSLFNESFGNLGFRFGAIIAAVFSVVVVWLGFKKLLKINIVIVPIMIFLVLFVIINCVLNGLHFEIAISNIKHNLIYALLNTISFIVSNLFFAGFIIAKIGKDGTTKSNVFASLFGTVFMVLCILCLVSAIYYYPLSQTYDMPLVFIATQQNFVLGIVAKVVVWLGITTTAITLLYQISNWLQSYFGKSKLISVVISLVAIIFSALGFNSLINHFYPILGILGFIFMIFVSKAMSISVQPYKKVN